MFMLAKIRKEKGLSQQQLSVISGVPKRTIEDIERFKVPRIDTAAKLAKALGCTLDELWEDDALTDAPMDADPEA